MRSLIRMFITGKEQYPVRLYVKLQPVLIPESSLINALYSLWIIDNKA